MEIIEKERKYMIKKIIIFKIITVCLLFLLNTPAKASYDDAFSVYRPGIEVLKSLKGSNYSYYIQRIYVDPTEKNRLMVLIKPNYWFKLTKREKDDILSKISVKWEELNQNFELDSGIKAEVCFANI